MTTYTIGNMDCANCAKEVEDGVARLDGVNAVRVDFATNKMTLDGDIDFKTLKQRVEALGKTINTEEDAATEPEAPKRGGVIGFWDYLVARWETRLAVIGGGLTLLTLALVVLGMGEPYSSILYTVAMLIALYPIARSGLNALMINRRFGINLLMTIAAIGAMVIGEYLEAATVIFLFAVGEALEGYTADRARQGLRELLKLKPAQATRIHGDDTQVVPVGDLNIGETILVKSGETIPMDGEIVHGQSGINQAPITGESMPVNRTVGDQVYAGSINGDGVLHVRVTNHAEDNTLNRIIQLVEEAQSNRAPSQRLIDRFADRYTPGVVIAALLVAFVPPVFFGAPFYSTTDTTGWLYRALTMLVIACPCALVISTPVTVISAITAAARRGVLIKGGVYLEALAEVDTVAFDKTGTLTRGEPVVTQYVSINCSTPDTGCTDCQDVLALAAAVERNSTHPLANAVVAAAQTRQLAGAYAPAQDVHNLTGRGISGTVAGQTITLGSHTLFDERYPHEQALCDAIQSAEASGNTVMMLHNGEQVAGYITAMDEPRPTSKATVSTLNGLGLQTVMLTGDNAAVGGSASPRARPQ